MEIETFYATRERAAMYEERLLDIQAFPLAHHKPPQPLLPGGVPLQSAQCRRCAFGQHTR